MGSEDAILIGMGPKKRVSTAASLMAAGLIPKSLRTRMVPVPQERNEEVALKIRRMKLVRLADVSLIRKAVKNTWSATSAKAAAIIIKERGLQGRFRDAKENG